MGNELNSDEFETIFDLILCVIFMAFGVFAMVLMVKNLSTRVEILDRPDKIEVTHAQHITEDPYWFTGYQAYMFAWHMDELSYEPLSYIGGNAQVYSATESNPVNIPSVHTDDNSNKSVTLSVKDSSGNIIPQFLPWRNQMITGSGQGSSRSVKKSLASVASDNNVSLEGLYQGNVFASNKQLLFHLELTGDYKLNSDLGNDINSGGKTYQWVLAPYYH